MMFHKNNLLMMVLLILTHVAIAGRWNETTLTQSKQQAIREINRFINNDKNGEIAQHLSPTDQRTLYNWMQFDTDQRGFATLKQKRDFLTFLLKNSYRADSVIPYAALASDYSSGDALITNSLLLYRKILEHDDQSAVFALQQLQQLPLNKKEDQNERLQLYRRYGMALNDISVDDQQELPHVCLNFSQPVRTEPAQRWQDLVTITPTPTKPLTYRGDKLCFIGRWQTRYNVHIDAQLQAQNHVHLKQSRDETINTGVRAPMLRFAAEGNVLNAHDTRHLALTTANVDQVSVSLWQLPVNNLSNASVQRLIESPQNVSDWQLEKLLHREGIALFEGDFEVGDYVINENVTHTIFLDDMLKTQPAAAGVFVIIAKSKDTADDISTQLAFTVSNAGFSAYLTSEGLWAELRDLHTTKPIVGQTVSLYAKNNVVLGTAVTDINGLAHFAKPMISGKDGLRISHLINNSSDSFAYIDVDDKAYDLSGKGLSGQVLTTPLRSWIWADRGIYRPNDNAHVMWLLKHKTGSNYHDTPIWLELLRPDGTKVLDQMVKADDSGAYSFDYHFDHAAQQGNWSMKLYLGYNGILLANKILAVAAITPQQIEVAITPTMATTNNDLPFLVNADWLYGAPAAKRQTRINYKLESIAQLTNAWEGWQIGLHDEAHYSDWKTADIKHTNAQGKALFSYPIKDLPKTTLPLQLTVSANVDDPSGQMVLATHQQLMSRQLPYAALKSTDDKRVNVVLLDNQGQQQAGNMDWQLYRVHYDYYWYHRDGRWHYQHKENRELAKSGKVSVSTDQPTELKLPIDEGYWLLVVRDTQHPAEVAASLPLEFGQFARPMNGNDPDRITISSDKPRYRHGERVLLHLHAPFDGLASVKIAHDNNIIDNHLVTFTAGQAKLTLTWDRRWDNGLWLLANAWNHEQKNEYHRRAVGLHWLGGDLTPHQLTMNVDLPQTTLPETTLTLPIQVDMASNPDKKPTWVRVAVIDEGLYRLAKASFTHPLKAFFKKTQLNLTFFDVWGEIISPITGRQATLRSGAGEEEGFDLTAFKALPELDLQLVTYWSPPVKVDAQGHASVNVDLPRFNGRLRIMAAAWNETQLGSFEKTLTVRAPLVTTLYTPPYLSPGDSSSIRLRLHNTTDKPMDVTTAISSDVLDLNTQQVDNQTLAADEVVWVERQFHVTDNAAERAYVYALTGKQNPIEIKRFIDIRPATYPQKQQTVTVINAGQTQRIDAPVSKKHLSRQLFISTQSPIDPEVMLTTLATYPYGCVEQTTSKAWNNLLLKDLLTRYQLDENDWGNASTRESRLFSAQTRLTSLQHGDGGFSLWGDGRSDPWLSAYVADFLLTSQHNDQLSNTTVLTQVLQYLNNMVLYGHYGVDDIAYAHYILAKSGKHTLGSTLRLSETTLDNHQVSLNTPSSYLLGALIYHGELALAEKLMDAMNQRGIDENLANSTDHYGNRLRNAAQQLSILSTIHRQLTTLQISDKLKQGVEKGMNTAWLALQQQLAQQPNYSTQTAHWLARLATQLPVSDNQAQLTLNGQKLTVHGSQYQPITTNQAIVINNQDNHSLYTTLTDWVLPTTDSIAEKGYTITMRYEDSQGNPVDLSYLTLHQQVTAVATITRTHSGSPADTLFVYPLPAGLSVFPIDIISNRDWSKQFNPGNFSETRDDRHLVAFTIKAQETFTYAFILRATRQGNWHAPAYSIENMYQPEFTARYPSPIVNIK